MTDREKYLKVLEKLFYSMEKLESGVILPTSEVKTALAFAISSIKTDLKYDLLYEGEDELCNGDCDNCDFVDGDYCRLNEKSIPVNLHVTEIKKHQSDFSDLVAIHTEGLDEEIRCTMCTNSMKSDRGCDGSCIVNDKMYKEVMDVIEYHIADADKIIEPTTKNNFVDGKDNNVTSTDCISRQEAIDTIRQLYIDLATQKYVIDLLKVLPSVTPQEPKWIPCSEKLPEAVNVGALWKREVLITGYLSFDDKKKRFVATEHIDNVISKKDVNDVHVIAWMPLPEPYEPQESEDKECR